VQEAKIFSSLNKHIWFEGGLRVLQAMCAAEQLEFAGHAFEALSHGTAASKGSAVAEVSHVQQLSDP
jgi:F0F1-type ATP synthase delta subunit